MSLKAVKDYLARVFKNLPAGRRKPAKPARPLSADRLAALRALDDSAYGVNSHNAAPDLVATLARAGIRWHRIDFEWNLIEREKGVHDWTAVDATVDATVASGSSVVAIIAYTPRWASDAPQAEPEDVSRARMPRRPEGYLDFLQRAIDRYGSRISAVSIWNEPNLSVFFRGSREQYIRQLLVPGLELVRSAAPHLVSVGPDLSSTTSAQQGNPFDWMGAVLEESGGLLDVITHHQYDGDDTPAGRAREIDRLRELIVREGYGDRDLWITETGWEISERELQAQHLEQTVLEMERRPWWTKTFWYDSHGPLWGLLGPDGAPDRGELKPALTRYANVIAQHAVRAAQRRDRASLGT